MGAFVCKIWENNEPAGPSTDARRVGKTGERGENIPQHQTSPRIPFPLCVRVFIYYTWAAAAAAEKIDNGPSSGGVPAIGRTKGWRVNARVFCSRFAGTPVPASPPPLSKAHRLAPHHSLNRLPLLPRRADALPLPGQPLGRRCCRWTTTIHTHASARKRREKWRRARGGAAVSRLLAATRCRATGAGVNGVLFDYRPTTAARYRFENFFVLWANVVVVVTLFDR